MTNDTPDTNPDKPKNTVEDAWIAILGDECSIDPAVAENIVLAVFSDRRLNNDRLSRDEIMAIVRGELEEIDLRPWVEEYGDRKVTEEEEADLKARFLTQLEAGLDGRLYGPSFAKREIAYEGPEPPVSVPAPDTPSVSPGGEGMTVNHGGTPASATPGGIGDDIDSTDASDPPTPSTPEGPDSPDGPDTISGTLDDPAAASNMDLGGGSEEGDSIQGSPVRSEDEIPDEFRAAYRALKRTLEDEEPGVRVNATQALGDIGASYEGLATAVVETLTQMIEDDDPVVRQTAAAQLGNVISAHSDRAVTLATESTDGSR